MYCHGIIRQVVTQSRSPWHPWYEVSTSGGYDERSWVCHHLRWLRYGHSIESQCQALLEAMPPADVTTRQTKGHYQGTRAVRVWREMMPLLNLAARDRQSFSKRVLGAKKTMSPLSVCYFFQLSNLVLARWWWQDKESGNVKKGNSSETLVPRTLVSCETSSSLHRKRISRGFTWQSFSHISLRYEILASFSRRWRRGRDERDN